MTAKDGGNVGFAGAKTYAMCNLVNQKNAYSCSF
jgi:hypothetical protein